MFPDACKGQTLHQEIPLDEISTDESREDEDDTTSKTKQAVIMIGKEENAEDVDGLLRNGHMSAASSAQSIYEFSKEASGDANRVEPDYDSTGFCVQEESGRRHAQLIMSRMDMPTFEEVNEASRESEGAASSSEEGATQITQGFIAPWTRWSSKPVFLAARIATWTPGRDFGSSAFDGRHYY